MPCSYQSLLKTLAVLEAQKCQAIKVSGRYITIDTRVGSIISMVSPSHVVLVEV